MIKATHYRKAAPGSISFVAVGLVLGRTLSSYQLEEILICWLFFSLAFVSLAFVILAGILVYYAGELVIHWVSAAPRVISTGALCSEIIPAEGRSEFQATNNE